MQTIKLPDQETPMNFTQARLTAVGKADEILNNPVIVAWKDDKTGKFAPAIPGGTGDRWHDYGESNEGMLELQVADALHLYGSRGLRRTRYESRIARRQWNKISVSE